MKITDKQLDILEKYEGTCASVYEIANNVGILVKDVIDKMLDINLKKCPGCRWWAECHEFTDLEDNPKKCNSCEPLIIDY